MERRDLTKFMFSVKVNKVQRVSQAIKVRRHTSSPVSAVESQLAKPSATAPTGPRHIRISVCAVCLIKNKTGPFLKSVSHLPGVISYV